MKFEILTGQHVRQLLEFERDNRAYFEKFIAPRPSHFFSEEGVSAHIASLVSLYHKGCALPVLVIDGGSVIGRVNLRGINLENKQAEIGYRVAQSTAGKGIATAAVRWMCEEAAINRGLSVVSARVLTNNPASKAILAKCGFVFDSHIADFTEHRGQSLDCDIFRKHL